jgi:hypothetical protein
MDSSSTMTVYDYEVEEIYQMQFFITINEQMSAMFFEDALEQ